MKIGFPVNDNSLDAQINEKMSSATWLLVVESDDMSFEAIPAPQMSAGPGAGIQALTLLLDQGAQILMVGYLAPHIAQPLEKSGIQVITNVQGRVEDLVRDYRESNAPPVTISQKKVAYGALQKTIKQFSTMLPVLIGVVMISGLIETFLSQEMVLDIFSQNPFIDTIIGTFTGSVFAGNPINSYIIGQSLLELGAGWAGVCALMLSWVTIGLIQIPVEIESMGIRFTTVRYGATVILTVITSLLTVFFAEVW